MSRENEGKRRGGISGSQFGRVVILLAVDSAAVLTGYLAALFIRFEFIFSNIPQEYVNGYLWSMPYWVVVTIVVFYGCRLYHSIWQFAGMNEAARMIIAYVILSVCYLAGICFMKLRMPVSYYCIGYVLAFVMHVGARFSYRFLRAYRNRLFQADSAHIYDRIMVIGAGQAGQIIIKELLNSRHLQNKVCCVIDDDVHKKNCLLEGIRIVGARRDIPQMVERYGINRIIFAIPSASAADRKEILNICQKCNCRLQTVPGVYQLVNGEVSVSKLRNVEIADLLGRKQVKIDDDEVYQSIEGKIFLVTGGGGSVGSEICRQIALRNPRQLIIFDIYENNAYEIQQELRQEYPELDLVTLIGSVRNTNRINKVLQTYHPDVVFHAAAHKHVPLMETSPNEAIKNNLMGTYKTAIAAARAGAGKFVLISTDKAVNPTNIMGASKRMCEMVIQMMNRKCSCTEFVAVRFGNVLGSNGSVIPLFEKQIARGGPLTVTDRRIVRYFMTIPEAVSLVLQAAYYARGGEIFVLDMGEPVRIDDMARNLIRLSGYTPDVDINIEYTGLRPGEKLYEELLMDEEGLTETRNKLIHVARPIKMDDEWFRKKLIQLDEASYQETDKIREMVAEIVPTYKFGKGGEGGKLYGNI